MPLLRKVLVANRGEIACRVIRTCREMGIPTVAVFSEADRCALHVRMADEAYPIGPSPSRESYLVIERVLEAARRAGADAIHPGYGFLSENPAFARAVEREGLTLIGPPATAMEAMGDKVRAREAMRLAGVPIVPGTPGPVEELSEALELARRVGFPVMIKAAAGGGGKGMRRVDREAEFASAFRGAASEALSAFGDGRVYLEKYLEKPRHVEFQVIADSHGRCVHLGERECSVQRRHQKVIEETPSPILTPELRERMGEIAVRAATAVGYVGAGTIEFLVDAHRDFYFLEMNTRLQVEHPVTEWVRGVDLVRWQIQVASGEPLPLADASPPRGHAIEARVYAEDPERGFMPSPGRITRLVVPGGPGVRDDGGVYEGWEVPVFYDPMISKLSAWAPTREEAIARLRRALGEYVVGGLTTNIGWLRRVLAHPEFVSGEYDTGFLARRAEELAIREGTGQADAQAIAAAVFAKARQDRTRATAPREDSADGSEWKRYGRGRQLRRI